MRYKNIKTGAIIDSLSKITGKSWKPIDEVEQEQVDDNAEAEDEAAQDEYVEEEIELENMTNKELEELAKEQGIKLTVDDKKNKGTRIAAIAKAFE